MTAPNQSLRQASVRTITGTSLDYNGDWMALFDAAGIPRGFFDERFLAWLNLKLGTSYTSLPQAMEALAVANGIFNYDSIGTFDASTGGASNTLDWTQNITNSGILTALRMG